MSWTSVIKLLTSFVTERCIIFFSSWDISTSCGQPSLSEEYIMLRFIYYFLTLFSSHQIHQIKGEDQWVSRSDLGLVTWQWMQKEGSRTICQRSLNLLLRAHSMPQAAVSMCVLKLLGFIHFSHIFQINFHYYNTN
jgi:hypothetical protein